MRGRFSSGFESALSPDEFTGLMGRFGHQVVLVEGGIKHIGVNALAPDFYIIAAKFLRKRSAGVWQQVDCIT